MLTDKVCLLECNIDDMSGEFFGDVMDRLFAAGALDVWFAPVYGKKNRPLYMLAALMRVEDEEAGVRVLFEHSSTAGVRRTVTERHVMEREFVTVTVDGCEISVKKLRWNGITKYTPEWADCAKASALLGRPVREVYAEAANDSSIHR
jgi:uncharacterized protein (DUF111 family)